MAVWTQGVPSRQGVATGMHLLEENPKCGTPNWYFSRNEIHDCSPSRKDGIDFMKECELQKWYCSFICDLGKTLKVPQVTIACALMLCHRFYMRQSHAKNDWQIIATASIFLACKIEETPRSLRDVVVMAYKMMHKCDPSAQQRIRKIEFCNQQKEMITTGEKLLLVTIAFDFDIRLPYRPLVDALKKLQIGSDLARVAWNFINDWLCTTLCLRYKPHYIAAGSLFLAAKLQKVKLPTEKGKIWWQQFDISPKQLEEVIQEMVRLLEQDKKRAQPAQHGIDTQSTASGGNGITSSAQSTISSISNTSLHSSAGTFKECQVLGKRNIRVKEDLPCQTSESSGVSSIVDDCDGESQLDMNRKHSYSYSNIHANQIGDEPLKKRKCLA